ncbi:GerMN domain-containing protein [Paenalkalicoccus suaedae]|uniref:GerMN domain-containing protein n=1 Tax=Paenalkalicoccus suaedae TaxID=2592382 RepID=A0A859FD48_9BACI|nr:GerMN domain-containing protein [Paenalkalicoccus suaedae]QKS70175.1 GerMN domain-containing protein [Paenalkalicoccus suaedae]
MSKNKWTEDHIEKTLTDLPKQRDHRSKDDVFEAMMKQAEKSPMPSRRKKRPRPWAVPALASAAAVLLVVLMLPSFMNTGLFSSDQQINMESDSMESQSGNSANIAMNGSDEDSDQEMFSSESNSANEADQPVDNSSEASVNEGTDDSDVENDMNADYSDEGSTGIAAIESEENVEEFQVRQEESLYVTASVQTTEDGSAQYTVLTTEDANGRTLEEALLSVLVESDPTSGNYLSSIEQVTLNDPQAGTITLDFSDENALDSLSSTEALSLEEVLQETLALHKIQEVRFTANGEPLLVGPIGEDTLELSSLNRGYYLVANEQGAAQFVSGRVAQEAMTNGAGDPLNFVETLNQMQDVPEGEWYESAIADSIEIMDVRYEGESAFVIYDATENTTDEELSIFYEAANLTAKYYTLDTLQFVNESAGEVVEYQVQVP